MAETIVIHIHIDEIITNITPHIVRLATENIETVENTKKIITIEDLEAEAEASARDIITDTKANKFQIQMNIVLVLRILLAIPLIR
jgi:predicted AlkP superfamily phosphohydrolase/phosphomutase